MYGCFSVIGEYIYKLSGEDSDGDVLRFDMTSDNFELRDPRNGEVYLKKELDFEVGLFFAYYISLLNFD